MKSPPVSPSIGLLLVYLTMLACSEHELSTAPAPKPEPVLPSLTMGALSSFSGSLDALGGSFLPLPPYTDYPEGIKVVLTVSGSIHVTSDSHAQYFHKTVDAGPGGVWVDGTYQQCSVGVRIIFGSTGFGPAPCNPPANPPGSIGYDTGVTWSTTAVVQGSGTATRTPNIPWDSPSDCDTIVCHTYSGSQTVTIVPVAGDLDLQAFYALEGRSARKALFIHPFTNADMYAHQTVTFTDSTTPRGLPMKPMSHTWTMTDPSAPNGFWNHTAVPGSCLGSTPSSFCPVDIKETGIWTSQVRVNGVSHSEDITLYCSESEPLLNNDLVRQQMRGALDSSQAWSTNALALNERQFLVVQDTVTPGAMPHLMILPRDPTADECNGTPQTPTPASVPPNTRILAWGHTHPFEASDSNPTMRLAFCKDAAGRLGAKTMEEGASKEDRQATNAFNDPAFNQTTQAAGWLPMPSFIIDIHNVYVLRPGQALGDELNAGNKFSWDSFYKTPTDTTRTLRRCGWPKRIVP